MKVSVTPQNNTTPQTWRMYILAMAEYSPTGEHGFLFENKQWEKEM